MWPALYNVRGMSSPLKQPTRGNLEQDWRLLLTTIYDLVGNEHEAEANYLLYNGSQLLLIHKGSQVLLEIDASRD